MQPVGILDNTNEDSRELTEPGEINIILDQACNFDWNFDFLALKGSKVSSFPTKIVSFDENSNTLTMLGEFSKLSRNVKNKTYFRATSGGLSITFHCTQKNSSEVLTGKLCNFRTPGSIRFSQLRSAVRINFNKEQNIPVSFYANTENFYSGKVVDLSETGAKIKFVGNILEHTQISEIIADCKLKLPSDMIIESRVQVLGCVYDETADISFVRCKFLQLNDNNELQLKQFIYHSLSRQGSSTQ